jgi:hypothetical protein
VQDAIEDGDVVVCVDANDAPSVRDFEKMDVQNPAIFHFVFFSFLIFSFLFFFFLLLDREANS